MLIVITQSEKPHDTNQLHDELIAAGYNPWPVESTAEESRFTFPDDVDEKEVRKVVEKHTKKPRVPVDLNAKWVGVKEAKNFNELQKALVEYEEAKHPERK